MSEDQSCSTSGISPTPPPERPIPTPEEIRDLILYWVADEGEFPIDPPSEGWMAEALGVDRYTLRTMRDKAFERAELFIRRYSDWRLDTSPKMSASSSPPPSDGL
jgi:hypothetical protein